MPRQDSTAVCACPERCTTFVRTFSQRGRKYAVGCAWYAAKLVADRAKARDESRARDGEPQKRGPKPRHGTAFTPKSQRRRCQTCFDQAHRRASPLCLECKARPGADESLNACSARGIQYASTELVVTETQAEETDHEDEPIQGDGLLDADGHFRARVRRRRYGPRRARSAV